MDGIGVYVHVPFCDGKCPYCDFYSIAASEAVLTAYTTALCRNIRYWREKVIGRKIDTVYFGGGTPALLGAKRLNTVLETIFSEFSVTQNAEITVEANPGKVNASLFSDLRAGGFNRLSMGVQSANAEELRFLGRRHTAQQAADAFTLARKSGFSNISLDLMLGLKGQTEEQVRHSVSFCADLGAEHVSAYILKVEENTPFGRDHVADVLPDDDRQAELYHTACHALSVCGYHQYEISNFAQPGFESRHNLHYWRDEEYVGIGAAAHGFLNGKRFYYPRDIELFLRKDEPVSDGKGGSAEEYLMLALRLSEGVCFTTFQRKFGIVLNERFWSKAKQLAQNGLLILDRDHIALTEKGFLVSNSVIMLLLDMLF